MNETLQIALKGGLLLGGGGALELHNATIRRADGVPYIPASAIKGAIREQMVRLSDDPDVVDRILGAEGWPRKAGGPTTKVFFTDARLSEKAAERFRKGYGYGVRPQVSIDRRTRHAAAERLFQREIIAPFTGLVFEAGVDATQLDETDRKLVGAAIGAVFALGAARTSGLGRVEMSLGESQEATIKTVEIPEEETLDLVLEAVDPVCVGTDWQVGNFRATQLGIPASTLRGAVITAALRQQKKATDQTDEPWFRSLLLDPETCLRFGDAIPLTDDSAAPRPKVAPLTLRTCKHAREKHGVIDTLLRDCVHHRLAESGIYLALDEDCPVCADRTIPAGRWLDAGTPERRVMSRLALDPETARGKDGQLFSLELLERGTRFAVRLGNIGPEGRKLLRDAAQQMLRVGHGRGQGYGRMAIVEARPASSEALAQRLRDFDEAVRVALAGVEEVVGKSATDPDGQKHAQKHYLAATLTSDMIAPADGVTGGEDAFERALGLPGAERLYGQVRTGQRGGFQTRARAPKPYQPVVLAGSVLLLAVDSPFEATLLDRLRVVETHGIGVRREEGYGWVRFSDSTHQPGWRKP